VAILPLPEERSSWQKYLARHISKLRNFATKYYARGRKKFPAKKLSIKLFGGKIFLSTSRPPLSRLHLRHCTISYQMSVLLPADLGTRWTRNPEPWGFGPSSYPLGPVERIILILELRDEL
jgi:hypothetical protein